LKSDLVRADAHAVKPEEYKELPELTEEMLARATINKGGRPLSLNPRRLISLRLPADVIKRWRATGPGVANPHGGTAGQGSVTKPNKPFHPTPDFAPPVARSVAG
jgi:uncharacterized protein (DUF4415 family)